MSSARRLLVVPLLVFLVAPSAASPAAAQSAPEGGGAAVAELIGEIALHGAAREGTILTVARDDGGASFTVEYGQDAETPDGMIALYQAHDHETGNPIDGILSYFADVPPGDYTLTAQSGDATASVRVTAVAEGDSFEAHGKTYYMQAVPRLSLGAPPATEEPPAAEEPPAQDDDGSAPLGNTTNMTRPTSGGEAPAPALVSPPRAYGAVPPAPSSYKRGSVTDLSEPILGFHGYSPNADCCPIFGWWRNEFYSWGWKGPFYDVGYYQCDKGHDFYADEYGPSPPDTRAGTWAGTRAHTDPDEQPDALEWHEDKRWREPCQKRWAENATKPQHLGHSPHTPIQHIASHVAWFVYEEFTSKGQCVKMVAHSMGGLVIRYAIAATAEGQPGFPPALCVSHAVTLETPHEGTHSGHVCTWNQCDQMRYGSDFSKNIERAHYQKPQGVGGTRWTAIGGSGWDLVVPQWSAVAKGIEFDHEAWYTEHIDHANLFDKGYTHAAQDGRMGVREVTPRGTIDFETKTGVWPARATFMYLKYGQKDLSWGCGTQSEPWPLIPGQPTAVETHGANGGACWFRFWAPASAAASVAEMTRLGDAAPQRQMTLYARSFGDNHAFTDHRICSVAGTTFQSTGSATCTGAPNRDGKGSDPFYVLQVKGSRSGADSVVPTIVRMLTTSQSDCGVAGDAGDGTAGARPLDRASLPKDCDGQLAPGARDAVDAYRLTFDAGGTHELKVAMFTSSTAALCLYKGDVRDEDIVGDCLRSRNTPETILETVEGNATYHVVVAGVEGKDASYRLTVSAPAKRSVLSVGGDFAEPSPTPTTIPKASCDSVAKALRDEYGVDVNLFGQNLCDHKLYGLGGWKDEADLRAKVRERATYCSDPWVTLGFIGTLGRTPSIDECFERSAADKEAARAKGGGARCGDPWVTDAVLEVTQVMPLGKVCNVKLYGNGQWNGYADLVGKVRATLGACADPRVAQAHVELFGTAPAAGDCDARRYSGTWRTWGELKDRLLHARLEKRLLAVGAEDASRVCADPWVTQAFLDVTQQRPLGLVCNVAWYGEGSWNGYHDLVAKVRATLGKCNDYWVSQAHMEIYGRLPQPSECDVKRYGNGQWNDYADLKAKVREAIPPVEAIPLPGWAALAALGAGALALRRRQRPG